MMKNNNQAPVLVVTEPMILRSFSKFVEDIPLLGRTDASNRFEKVFH